jgi:hypothetical protein
MYKVTCFEWVTRDLQILYRDSRISEKLTSDCIATVAEHDQIHMFRDFVSKCVLGLRIYHQLPQTPTGPTDCAYFSPVHIHAILRSSLFWDVMQLRSVVTVILGQPIGATFKGQAVGCLAV